MVSKSQQLPSLAFCEEPLSAAIPFESEMFNLLRATDLQRPTFFLLLVAWCFESSEVV